MCLGFSQSCQLVFQGIKVPDALGESKLNIRVYFQYASGIKICKPRSECYGNCSTKMWNESCYCKCGSCPVTAVTAWHGSTLVQLDENIQKET